MIIIVAGSKYHNFNQYLYNDKDYFIGIEEGCNEILKRGFKLNLALGDFDNIHNFKDIKDKTDKLIIYPKEKDQIDLELALMYLRDNKIDEDIIIYNSLYGRMDHELITIKLLIKYSDLKIRLVSDNEYISLLTKDTIIKKNKRFSLIPFEETCISIIGASYNLNKVKLDLNDNYTSSNYSLDETKIIIHFGRIILIEENKKG